MTYVIQRIDSLGRGATFNVNASSGDYVRAFAGTLATSLRTDTSGQRQAVTLVNPSSATAMYVKLTPASEATASNVNDNAKYPVAAMVPAGSSLPFQIGPGIRIWVRSASASSISDASALEGL